MDKIAVPVSDEEKGRTFTLQLTQTELERAQADGTYLQELVAKFYEEETQNSVGPSLNQNEEDGEQMENIIVHEETNNRNGDVDNEEKLLFIWTSDCIHLLLTIYEEQKEKFRTMRHKKIFDLIARKMTAVNSNYKINGAQCQSKINSLKKTYKKIKDHNNTSGNNRATWPYYERMQDVFGTEGWVEPRAVATEAGPGPEAPTPTKRTKRKSDNILEELVEAKKTHDKQKQVILEKFLIMKQNQHEEKMKILREICQNIRKD